MLLAFTFRLKKTLLLTKAFKRISGMRKSTAILLPAFSLMLLFAALTSCNRPELLSPSKYSGTTIIAGSDSAGFANGTGTAARFNHPFGLTLDKSGNLYVA